MDRTPDPARPARQPGQRGGLRRDGGHGPVPAARPAAPWPEFGHDRPPQVKSAICRTARACAGWGGPARDIAAPPGTAAAGIDRGAGAWAV